MPTSCENCLEKNEKLWPSCPFHDLLYLYKPPQTQWILIDAGIVCQIPPGNWKLSKSFQSNMLVSEGTIYTDIITLLVTTGGRVTRAARSTGCYKERVFGECTSSPWWAHALFSSLKWCLCAALAISQRKWCPITLRTSKSLTCLLYILPSFALELSSAANTQQWCREVSSG